MYIVGVTSCATGIAHTYMAAEAIQKVCKKNGHKVKVETQGAMGQENKLSAKDIAAANFVIFANDVKIKDSGRFDSVPEEKLIKLTPHAVIADPTIVMKEIEGR